MVKQDKQIIAAEKTVNVMNLMALKKHLINLKEVENPEIGFDMWPIAPQPVSWKPECGAVCCLAGHVILLKYNQDMSVFEGGNGASLWWEAEQWLGIDIINGNILFTGKFICKPMPEITIDDAVKALDILIEGGNLSCDCVDH